MRNSNASSIRTEMIRAAGVLVAAVALSSCRLGPGVEGLVDLAPPDSDSLRLVYLGTG